MILNRRLAESFMRLHRGVSIIVEGGGTSIGVEALIAGEAPICAASRPLSPTEVQRLFERFGTLGVRLPIARDALSVWVHPDNPVRNLSLDQLGGIFGGSVTSWSAVGGADREITVVVRPPASGTFRFFRDRVLRGGAYTSRAVTAAATLDVIRRVADDETAIGYGGAAYGEGSIGYARSTERRRPPRRSAATGIPWRASRLLHRCSARGSLSPVHRLVPGSRGPGGRRRGWLSTALGDAVR